MLIYIFLKKPEVIPKRKKKILDAQAHEQWVHHKGERKEGGCGPETGLA